MKLFGAGVLAAVPLYDAAGNAITNPTPAPFGILQDVTLDFEFEEKPLYGANQFPVAVGRGKGKVNGKAKFAKIYASLFNAAFWGQPAAQSSGFFAIYNDTVGQAIPGTPFQITVTPPSTGTWDTDLGVTVNDISFKRVAATPAAGEYTVTAGVYLFNTADTGKTVFINYRYTSATVTGATKTSVANLLMGYAPTLQVDLSVSYAGKFASFRLPNALPSKFAFNFKNDDWTIPDFDFNCFADNNNNIAYYSMSE